MFIRNSADLEAFQLARDFKLEVYRVVEACTVPIDYKYRSQLFDAASGVEANIDEGFERKVPGETSQFLRYAVSSLSEARTRLEDGIHRQYFTEKNCALAFGLAKRCKDVTWGLHRRVEEYRRKQASKRRRDVSTARR